MRNPLKNPALWTAVGVLLASAIGWQYAVASLKYQLRKLPIYAEDGVRTRDIGLETTNWIKHPEIADRLEAPEIESELGTQNYVSRWYLEKKPSGGRKFPRSVEVHLAYYTGQIDTVPHVPDRCFVGGGMQINRELGAMPLKLDQSRWSTDPEHPTYRTIRTSDDSPRWPARYPHLPRDPESIQLNTKEYLAHGGVIYSGYFFIANGGHTPSANGVRLLSFDIKEKYAYYLKVQVTGSAESPEAFADAASSVLGELMGDIMMTVPDWVKVLDGRYIPAQDSKPESANTPSATRTEQRRGA